jgi:glycine/D-amino acid oxidase-like deaminating enzyme
VSSPPRVVVVGGGIAAAAIAHALMTSRDVRVTVVAGSAPASTDHNQRWKHSGLLYESRELARSMWLAHRDMDDRHERPFVAREGAHFLARDERTLAAFEDRWDEWGVRGWGLHPRRLDPHEWSPAGAIGEVRAGCGVATPDCTFDFRGVASSWFAEAARNGADLLTGRDVVDLRTAPGDHEVVLDDGTTLAADCCVVAAGARSPALARRIGLVPAVVVRRCAVVELDGELVDRLTVCLDARGPEHHSQDLSLAPFQGVTLAAEPDGDVVDDVTDEELPAERYDDLLDAYAEVFPDIRTAPVRSRRQCFKIEQATAADPILDPHVVDVATQAGWPPGLILAIPGKASLARSMARSVVARVDAALGGRP